MFQIDDETWNGRLFNPKGKDKSHNHGPATGKIWKHPAAEYNPEKETFATEGIIDALSLIEIGKQAVAILSSVSDPEKTDLSEFRKLVFAFDNDASGWQALKKWKKAYPDADAVMPVTGDCESCGQRNQTSADLFFDLLIKLYQTDKTKTRGFFDFKEEKREIWVHVPDALIAIDKNEDTRGILKVSTDVLYNDLTSHAAFDKNGTHKFNSKGKWAGNVRGNVR